MVTGQYAMQAGNQLNKPGIFHNENKNKNQFSGSVPLNQIL